MRNFLPTLLVCASLTAGVFALQAALSMAAAERDSIRIVATVGP
jgi:hypothetical protein